MSKFDLELKAHLLWPERDDLTHRSAAIQLARELAEAIAAEIEGPPGTPSLPNVGMCADIARSFVRPRTHEDVMREALQEIMEKCAGDYKSPAHQIADKALHWRQP